MPLVGLCGEPKEALEKIEYMMQALSLQGQFSKEDPTLHISPFFSFFNGI